MHRHHVVASQRPPPVPENQAATSAEASETKPIAPMSWMQRRRRGFDIDLSMSALWRAATRDCSRLTEPNRRAHIVEHRKARQRHEDDARAPPLQFAC
jgi:hypothetical protein